MQHSWFVILRPALFAAEGPMQVVDCCNSAGKVHRSFVTKNDPQDDKRGAQEKLNRFQLVETTVARRDAAPSVLTCDGSSKNIDAYHQPHAAAQLHILAL